MTLQEAIVARHSVRKYIDKEIPADIITALQDKIAECNKVGNLNIQLVLNETRAFTGMLYGEQLVLLAQTLGLNTCWVGLSYRKVEDAYNVGKDEKLVCVIAIGYGETQGVAHKVKNVEQVSNASDLTPAWFKKGIEAALLAPTAVNQQKFSFEYIGMKDNKHIVKAKKGFSIFGYTSIDLGIARCHFDIVVGDDIFRWV